MPRRRKKEPFPVQKGKPKEPCPHYLEEDKICAYQPNGHQHTCISMWLGAQYGCSIYLQIGSGKIVL